MALAVTTREVGGDTSNVAVYAGGTINPSANGLLVVALSATQASSTDPGLPTITNTGVSLTWIQIADHKFLATSTNRARLTIFAAALPASPGSMIITATYPAALVGCCRQIFDITGSDVAHGVLQSFVQTVLSTAGLTGTSGAVTLAAAANSNNRSLMLKGHLASEAAAFTSPWASIPGAAVAQHTSPNSCLHAGFNPTAFDTNCSCTWTSSVNYGIVGFEIKAAATVSYTVSVTPASISFPAFSSVGTRVNRLAVVTAPPSPLLTFSPVGLLRTYKATIPTINFAYTVNAVSMVKQKAPAIFDSYNIPLTFNVVGLIYVPNPVEPETVKQELRPAPGRLKPGDKVYVSVQGDMWDLISEKVYGMQRGSDRHLDQLIEANPEFMDYSSMPGGLYIFVPPLPVQTTIPLVPWKRTTVIIKT